MKLQRTENARRSIISGEILKIYQLLMPFLMRTIIIYLMGMEYVGLNSLFTSILQVLNLAELGVGSAMVYSMYAPIASDNKEEICALLKLYRRLYYIIGAVIAVLGIGLLPFIPYLVKKDLPPELNLYVLYLLNLGATVLSYWLFAYRSSILLAHQRNDVISRITLVVSTMQYALQILVLFLFHNYYLYLIIALIFQVLLNIVSAYMAKRLYPEYVPAGDLPKEEKSRISRRIRDLFTSRVGSVIVNSSDTLVISAFLGLIILAMYQNYFLILSSLIGLVSVIFQACIAGVGNSLIVDSREKTYADFKQMTFLISWIAGVGTCGLLCLYQPFMRIWVGEENMLSYSIVFCLCVYFYIYEINQLLNMYKDAAGIWHVDRFRTLTVALVNLSLNLLTVKWLGLYGVILSTVVSTLIIGLPWLLNNLFNNVFSKDDMKEYIVQLVMNMLLAAAACILTFLICMLLSRLTDFLSGAVGISSETMDRKSVQIVRLFLRFVVCMFLSNGVLFFRYRKTEEYANAIILLKKFIKRN